MPGIRLEFAQFGDFDYFEVIRSLTPMTDLNNLPAPIATNLLTMFYVDTSIVEGETYYYRVAAWRDSNKAVSDEVKVVASTHLINLIINGSNEPVDIGVMQTTWVVSDVNLKHINNEIEHKTTASYLKTNENFRWSGAWEIEFDVFINSSVANDYYVIAANKYNEWVWGGIFIYFGGNSSAPYEQNRFGIGNYGTNGLMSNVLPKDTWHHIICRKTADHKYSMIINDITQYDNQYPQIPSYIPTDGIINIGMILTTASGNGVRVRNFKIRDMI